jgi:tetratricopeptide (TPR) repeat protein
MATVLLMLPLAGGVRGVWLLLLAVAVMWWFLSSRERLLLGMLAVGGLIVSLLLPRVFGFLASDGDPALRLVIDVASGRATEPALARVQLADETSDTVAARALGMLRAGQPDDAEALYQEALARWAADPRLLSDYGSLHFHRQDYARAVELYEAARAQAPDSVAVLYNLSQAYRADLRFEEGEARYQEARAIDPGLLDAYAERGRMGDAFLVVDYGFHPKELWTMALAPRALPAFLAASVERLRRHLSLRVTIGIAALIVVCWLFSRVTPNPAAVSCTTCGTAVCRRCQRYFLDIKLCSSCWKAYAKGITLLPNTPLPQVRQRWIVRRRVAAVLSLIPGVGHLVLGRPFWGFSFAFLGSWLAWMGWLSFSSWNTLGERLFASPWYIVWAPVFVAWLALYALIAVHLLGTESPAVASIGTGRQDTARGR